MGRDELCGLNSGCRRVSDNFRCCEATKIVDHTLNTDLKSLHIKNMIKIIVGQLNINSIKNKFDFLVRQVKGNTDICIISETKLDESFPVGKFLVDGYSVAFSFDRNGNGGGVLLYIREDIPLEHPHIKTLRVFPWKYICAVIKSGY